MEAFVYRIYRRNGHDVLDQIDYTANTLPNAKQVIERRTACRFEEVDGQIYAIVNDQRMFRIEPQRLV